jgi:hypothetical protein
VEATGDWAMIEIDGAQHIIHWRPSPAIPLGAIAVELLLPFHHVGFAAVFLDQPGDAVTALARAFGAFDAEHVELLPSMSPKTR